MEERAINKKLTIEHWALKLHKYIFFNPKITVYRYFSANREFSFEVQIFWEEQSLSTTSIMDRQLLRQKLVK